MKKLKTRGEKRILRESGYHRKFAMIAATQADRVLRYFESERPNDARPRNAIKAIRAWAGGERELGMAVVRKRSLDAHTAARASRAEAARYAARAAGHAIAAWHVPTHAMAVPMYVQKAINADQNRRARRRIRPPKA